MIKFLFGFFITGVVAIIVVLTLFGITPLSSIVRTGQENLTIKTTPNDVNSAITKMGTETVSLSEETPDSAGFRLEGTKDAKFILNNLEVTALLNNPSWKNYPLKNVQTIIIYDQGLLEVSATLQTSKILPFALSLGYTKTQAEESTKRYNLPSLDIPIYISGKFSVKQNQTTATVYAIKVGAVGLPKEIVTQASIDIKQLIDDLIRRNSQSINVESLIFEKGNALFEGKVAEKMYITTSN